MKRISILGSTGSIGTQTLDVIDRNREEFSVAAVSCASNVELLKRQIEHFRPAAVCVRDEKDALELGRLYRGIEVFCGDEGLKQIASMEDCDMVVNSLMGMRGLGPTMAAVEAGKDMAFANKETLVAGGELVMAAVKRMKTAFLPVDSEHSAIFQALQGSAGNEIRRIILTASGGPFRGYSLSRLRNVTLEQALAHPNWSMGKKITIDSATMMNKGLEVIEAKWLFDVPLDRIQIAVHPQSVLHSAVEFRDGSIIGQMGVPDMRVPISYALSYPERKPMPDASGSLDLFSLKDGMTFYPPDRKVFRTIDLAYEASERGGSCPAALNAANEVFADMFLKGMIGFTDIQDNLERIMDGYDPKQGLDLEGILAEDLRIRELARKLVL